MPAVCADSSCLYSISQRDVHESVVTLPIGQLDAVANHEWRIMPILRSLPEEIAFTAFVMLHIPIFAVLLALVFSSDDRVRTLSRIGVSVFLLALAGLHMFFSGRADYEFDSLLSILLIYGGAVSGGLYLVVSRRESLQSQ